MLKHHELPCGCVVEFKYVEFHADWARVDLEVRYCAEHNDLAVLRCGRDLFLRPLKMVEVVADEPSPTS